VVGEKDPSVDVTSSGNINCLATSIFDPSVKRTLIIAVVLRNSAVALLCMGTELPNLSMYLELGFKELYSPPVVQRHLRVISECVYDGLVERIELAVRDLDSTNGGRILVYFPFVSHCEKFASKLSHFSIPVAQLHGKANDTSRALALSRDHRLGIIVGNISMAYGLNLPGASYLFYVGASICHGICLTTGAHVGVVTRLKTDQRKQLFGRCGRDISDHCNVITEILGFPIHVKTHEFTGSSARDV
jgi:hypothetical protein